MFAPLLLAGSLSLGICGENDARLAKAERQYEKGKVAYVKKDYAKAENYFRQVTELVPDHLISRIYLGHSLFYQGKYVEAVREYERARITDKTPWHLSETEERVLMDQLGMSYGLSGRLTDAEVFYEDAIKKDPSFPLYYYNLACTFAEMGKLEDAIRNLRLASERRSNMLAGETFPNPRQDESFKRYLGNEAFESALKELGFGP